MASIEQSVLRIIGDHLGIPGSTLSLDTHLRDDLGADSLDMLELIMTLEEFFGIHIADQDASAAERIRDVVAAIERASQANGGTSSNEA